MTVRQLATLAGIGEQTLLNAEKGLGSVRKSTYGKIAAALGVYEDELFIEDG